MSTLEITYHKNPLYSGGAPQQPRFFAALDLRRYGMAARAAELPIFFRRSTRPTGPPREVYSARVAGLLLEHDNLQSMEKMLDYYLAALVRFGRLPEYVFQLGTNAWPIYRLPNQLATHYPGGPVFSGSDIAELRIWLADHFKGIGRIQIRKELSLLYFSRSDLQLYPQNCALRTHGMADIPAFSVKNEQGRQLLAHVNDWSVAVPIIKGAEIFDLHQKVGKHLVTTGRLTDPYDVTVRKLQARTWARIQAWIAPHPHALCYCDEVDRQLPIFVFGRSLVAARTNRLGRTTLYLAPDIWALQARVGADLYAQGKLRSPDHLTITG